MIDQRARSGGVFLSPDLNPCQIGGVQTSGRAAWAALAAALPADSAHLLTLPAPAVGRLGRVRSKTGAVMEALRWRQLAEFALVWHIGLLKLVPLLRARPQRVALFLHGIESWRRHGAATRLLLGRVDLFLSNSDYTWERFLAHYPELASRAHRTVHLGLDEPAAPAPTPAGPPAALIIGRLARSEDYKGHRELIAAWPLVRGALPDAELWVAGEGDLRPDLKALARARGVADGVRFLGRVSEDEKERLIAASRCLAMPSRGEGFGLVYLEAMRLGRPCLVSTLDAGREVVNPPEAGLAADPADRGALASALIRLIDAGPGWETWSEAARLRYSRRFTAEHYSRRLLDALSLSGPGQA